MRYDFEVKEVDKQTALDMVQKYHYSNTLPKLSKVYLGFYTDWGGKEKRLVGLITLGWGTRPFVKIHARKMKALFASPEDKRITVRPTLEQMKEYDIKHYRGKQYRYFKFLCGKQEKRHLLKECQVDLTQPLPKYEDLKWRVKDMDTGKWMDCGKPPYVTDFWKGDDDD